MNDQEHSIQVIPNSRMRIIFLHHSTGRRLINQGCVRQLIETRNLQEGTALEFWDHDYNRIGLRNAQGQHIGPIYNVPDDNTDPDGLEILFQQPVHDPPDNALSHLLTYDVVIFKSCFPASAIRNEFQLERYQSHYRVILRTLAAYPKVLFLPMTPPPLIPLPFPSFLPAWTNIVDAQRARRFANWLRSPDFRDGLPNVAVFDLFDRLAFPENHHREPNIMRAEYRGFLGLDSHPNPIANRTVAREFVDFIFASILAFRKGRLNRWVVLDE